MSARLSNVSRCVLAAVAVPHMQLGWAVHGLGEGGHEFVEDILLPLVLRQAHVLEHTTWQVWPEVLERTSACSRG